MPGWGICLFAGPPAIRSRLEITTTILRPGKSLGGLGCRNQAPAMFDPRPEIRDGDAGRFKVSPMSIER